MLSWGRHIPATVAAGVAARVATTWCRAGGRPLAGISAWDWAALPSCRRVPATPGLVSVPAPGLVPTLVSTLVTGLLAA